MIDDDLKRLRAALGAANDSELAGSLGISRFAVSRWKQRGVIPAKYRWAIEADGVAAGVQFIVRNQVYAHPDHHYWLRAALHFLPPAYLSDCSQADRARVLDLVVTRLMGAAADATIRDLGKARCESEADYQALVQTMAGGMLERIERTLNEGAALTA